MLRYSQRYFLIAVVLLIISACASKRNLVCFSDLSQNDKTGSKSFPVVLANSEVEIQPNDILNIIVTSLSIESNHFFNNYNPNNYYNSNNGNLPKEGYRVDKSGFISFPVLSHVKLAGLTISFIDIKELARGYKEDRLEITPIIKDANTLLIALADAFSLTPYTDASVYVIRYDYTPKAHLGILEDIYKNNKLKSSMIILNDGKTQNLKSYGYVV